jgi:DNA (cytosine-5)-methyltransferase 1
MSSISSLDLFCGAGGLSLGLKAAGVKTVGAFDSDLDSVNTYNHNLESVARQVDIFDLLESQELREFRGVELLAGGPPCQGFCLINPKRRTDDPRNSCLDAFLYAVKVLQPKYCLIENVTGLISLGHGFAIKKLESFFSDIGYKYSYKVLQAAHYGVPQSRWRFILLASRLGSELNFPLPSHAAIIRPNFARGRELTFPVVEDLLSQLTQPTTVLDAIGDLPDLANGGHYIGKYIKTNALGDYATKLHNKNGDVLNHRTRKMSELQMQRIFALKNPGDNWTNLPPELLPGNLKRLFDKYGTAMGSLTRFRRLEWNKQFSTIVTSPDPYWGAFIHPVQHRVISVREAARAQGFPDDFEFTGSMTSSYRQIGNAVPPILASAIGTAAFKNG